MRNLLRTKPIDQLHAEASDSSHGLQRVLTRRHHSKLNKAGAAAPH